MLQINIFLCRKFRSLRDRIFRQQEHPFAFLNVTLLTMIILFISRAQHCCKIIIQKIFFAEKYFKYNF